MRSLVSDRAMAVALALFFSLDQFYTSLANLSPTPPVGYVFASRTVAGIMVALMALAAALCLSALWVRRAEGGDSLRPSLQTLGLWLGATLLAALGGIDPLVGLEALATLVIPCAFHLGLVRWYGHPPVARAVVVTYLCVGFSACVAALVFAIVRRPEALYALNHGRAAGFFVTANQFANFLLLFGFTALGVALGARRMRLRALGWAAAGAAFVSLLATFSQGGWIGAAAGAVGIALGLGARRTAAGLAAFALALGLALVLRPATHHNPAESFERFRTIEVGLRVVELFPLSGVGPMAYWRVYPALRPPNGDPPGTFPALHPHNVLVSLAGEFGLLGLALVLLGWQRLGTAVVRAARAPATPLANRRLALGVGAGLAAALVQGMFDTIGYVQMTFVWIPYLALALGAARHGLDGTADAP